MRTLNLIAAAIIAALCFAIYGNNYQHAYHLDDAYTLVSNTHVRSLSNIPRYFADPATYTTLREQADYRPVLQATYALNYRMGGYQTPWWHFTQVLLHALVAIGLYCFARRLLLLLANPPSHPERHAFAAAAIFAVHPAASGVVNYFNARSSLLTAVFLLPALLAYMRPRGDATYPRPQWGAALWLTLALFTKVEAVGALGALWAFELWQRAREAPGVSLPVALHASFDRRTWRRLAPALAVTAVYFVIRTVVMAPFPFDETRHAADVGAYEYFLTQLTAWWHYVARWLAPVRLVSDHLAYPVYRSITEPVVLLALAGWTLVAAVVLGSFRRAPQLLFLGLAALALLSPTSSVAPLAEMVNEHRPYLPLGLLFTGGIALVAPHLIRWQSRAPRMAIAGSALLGVAALASLTWQRNLIFRTPATFWRDVLAKAPSSRAHLNYGLALAGGNDLDGAMRHYRDALRLAPQWYYTHINMAIVHARLGQPDSARAAYDRAVEFDRYSGHALTWRAEFRLAQRDFAGARDDLQKSNALSLAAYRNTRALATAYAGLGDVTRALDETLVLIRMDSATALTDVPGISNSFFENSALRASGIDYYRRLERHLPGTWWIPENITRLERLLATR